MKISAFSKTYDGRCVLDFPGMELRPGKIYAVIGANGSGKSTFAKVLSGMLPADKKTTLTDGGTIGYMPQKNYAYRMSAEANILLNGQDRQRAEMLMESLRIQHLAKKRADTLSGGETARMALARLMMKSYDMVLLDEPTAAMDMETTLLSEKLIVDYVRETNCALILVTHSLRQARRIADHIWYFHKGTVPEAGEKDRVLHTPEKPETKQFLEFYGM